MALTVTVASLDPLRHVARRVRSRAHTVGEFETDIENDFQEWYLRRRDVTRRDRPWTRGPGARRRGTASVSPAPARDGPRPGDRGQGRDDRAARRSAPDRGSRRTVVDPEVRSRADLCRVTTAATSPRRRRRARARSWSSPET